MTGRWCSNPPRDVVLSLIRLSTLASMPHFLVQLDGDSQQNLETWDAMIRDFLGMETLQVFLDSDIREPDRDNSRLWLIWSIGRGVAKYVVCRTLEKPHVRERLLRHGWDSENQSPKYHYDIVWDLWGYLIPA